MTRSRAPLLLLLIVLLILPPVAEASMASHCHRLAMARTAAGVGIALVAFAYLFARRTVPGLCHPAGSYGRLGHLLDHEKDLLSEVKDGALRSLGAGRRPAICLADLLLPARSGTGD